MIKSVEPLPCPKCGSVPYVEYMTLSHARLWRVRCDNLDGHDDGKTVSGWPCYVRADAIAGWNEEVKEAMGDE